MSDSDQVWQPCDYCHRQGFTIQTHGNGGGMHHERCPACQGERGRFVSRGTATPVSSTTGPGCLIWAILIVGALISIGCVVAASSLFTGTS